MSRQKTIIGEIRKRGDLIYTHELEDGDVFCRSMSEFRAGKANRVVSNNFSKPSSDWSGDLTYKVTTYSQKLGKDIVSHKQTKDATGQVIFLKKGNA